VTCYGDKNTMESHREEKPHNEVLEEAAEVLAELFIRQLDTETNLKGRSIKQEDNYERKN